MSDRELLERYAASGDPAAFAALVKAHVNLVYSCARREVKVPHLAEDVTQVVFAILARKAGRIRAGVVLEGWLFKTTRFVALNALREKRRREKHEHEAANMALIQREQRERDQHSAGGAGSEWAELEPHLQDAMARLRAPERDAVLLRYFKSMTMRQVADALAIREDAAAKRVSRALERMRRFFAGRGMSVSAGLLGTALVTHAVEAAPPRLADMVAGSSLAGTSGPISASAEQVLREMTLAKVKLTLTGTLAAGLVLGLATFLTVALGAQVGGSGAKSAAAAASPADAAQNLPGIAPGWPVTLPGNITGTPAVGDVDGDGVLEIVVPTLYSGGDTNPIETRWRVAHPQPRIERLVHALRPDGKSLDDWPAVIMDAQTRQRERQQLAEVAEYWATSPAVMDWRGTGRDSVAITNRIGVATIEHTVGGPLITQVSGQGDAWASVPLADVDGDGHVDVVMGWVLASITGQEIAGWPFERVLRGGFNPAIADVLGDGEPLLYHPYYAASQTVCGYDRFGRILPGWPQSIVGHCISGPSLGDVDGDGKMEVVAANGSKLYAWTWDGQPLPGTRQVGRTRGVFKDGLRLPTSPTLADLDGDGKAEVIVLDATTHSIKAWRADGSGLTSEDGTIVRLEGQAGGGGVSVADLAGDGVIDLFAGTWWIQLAKDGKTRMVNMISEASGVSDTFCTIVDLEKDGSAEIVFGLRDGRLYVYRTGLAYKPQWVKWQTRCGNMRRTGAATPPPFKAAGSAADASPQKLPDRLFVNVVDATTKQPLAGAALTLDLRAGEARARCDEHGGFTVPLREQRWVGILAEAPGHASVRAMIEAWSFVTQNREELILPLPPGVPIGGVVRDAQGRAVASARVLVRARARIDDMMRVEAIDQVVTDDQGRWRSDRIPERYDGLWVRVEHPAYATEDARLGKTSKSAAALRQEASQLILQPVKSEVEP